MQKSFSDSEMSPGQAIESPSTSKFVETKPMDTPTSDKTSKPAIALPSEYQSPVSVGVTSSHTSPTNESDKCADDLSQHLPLTPPASGSIAFPTPSTSASTSMDFSPRRSSDELPHVPSLEPPRIGSSSNRRPSLYGAPPLPPPSGPLPPIPLSPPPPTPPPKDVPVSFGKVPPPKSFRQLYSAGQLPPASRGPGMHQSARGRPLLGRTTSLCDRPLPPIPIPNVPRRSSSAVLSGSSGEFQLLFIFLRAAIDQMADRMRTTSMHVPSLQTVPASPHYLPPENPPSGKEKAYPTLVPYHPRLRTVSSPLQPRLSHFNPSSTEVKPRAREDTDHSRGFSSSSSQSGRTARYQPPMANPIPSSYRSPSPTPSNFSSSQAGTVCSILGPDFDRRIFDAFPDVPRQLPDPKALTRQRSLEASGSEPRPRTPVIAVTIAPPDGQETERFIKSSEQGAGNALGCSNESTRAKTRPVSMPYGENASEMGQWAKQASPVRERKKSTSRPLIPTWYGDDDYDENEAGWASISVVRRRIA